MTRVLIADDHALFRQGLRSLLESIDNIEVVGEAEDGRAAEELVVSLAPDLVLMDINMPGCDGLEATRRIKALSPEIKVLIVSMHADHSFVRQALHAGAAGFIFKGAPFAELKGALESVINNAPYLSPSLLGPVLNDFIKYSPGEAFSESYNKLTQREKEVFSLLGSGKGRQEIAERLFISPKTVDRHKSNLKEKLGFQSDGELQEMARKME